MSLASDDPNQDNLVPHEIPDPPRTPIKFFAYNNLIIVTVPYTISNTSSFFSPVYILNSI